MLLTNCKNYLLHRIHHVGAEFFPCTLSRMVGKSLHIAGVGTGREHCDVLSQSANI